MTLAKARKTLKDYTAERLGFANYAATVLAAKPRAGGGWADFRCGIHDDGSASASINLSDAGRRE